MALQSKSQLRVVSESDIPVEILAYIFYYACFKVLPGSSLHCHRKTRLSIIATCRVWRDVVLQRPDFWSVVNVDWFTYRSATKRTLKSIELSVSRSRGRPLTLQVEARGHKKCTTAAIRLVQKYIGHCEHLSVDIDVEGRVADPLDALRSSSDLSRLRTLIFEYDEDLDFDDTEEDDSRTNELNLASATSLQDLCISREAGNASITLPPSETNSLRRLHITGHVITQALRGCIRLDTLDWFTDPLEEEDQSTLEYPIDLPQLRHLQLRGGGCLLRAARIIAPNLIRLSITINKYWTNSPLRPSFPKLRYLAICVDNPDGKSWEREVTMMLVEDNTKTCE